MANNVKFRISSGLKNIIGRELITDDFIAVFELVKNAYDAHAKEVKVIFEDDRIIIRDDGKGMSYDDLLNKWLFVAYSAKKEGIEDEDIEGLDLSSDYRDRIQAKRHYAGAKGIGRFSCDKLGSQLRLITKKAISNSAIEQLEVNWEHFEEDASKDFIEIDVKHQSLNAINYIDFKYGTILEISDLREGSWPRQKKQHLKQSLEKLINPFGSLDRRNEKVKNDFNIIIESTSDLAEDQSEKYPRNIVNGPVKNFIFETLNVKTTQIITKIDEDGKYITTDLIDRGTSLYKLREKNHSGLSNIQFHLFHLNQAAKNNFTRRMGIAPINFGHVFLFRNGFRVYPYGEVGEDSFGFDRRKQQRYKEFLGTRDLIGRVEIIDDRDTFKESSSRDAGLIECEASKALREVLIDKCLRRLEIYTSKVLWKIESEKFQEDLSELQNAKIDEVDAKEVILNIITKLSTSDDVIEVIYNKDFLNIIQKKVEEATPKVFKELTTFASKAGDAELTAQIQKAENEYNEIKKVAREEIKLRDKVEIELKQKTSQNLFLKSISTRDFDQIISYVHHIGIFSETIDNHLELIHSKIKAGKSITKDQLIRFIDEVSFANKKISAFAKFATKSNYKQDEEIVEEDLVSFIIDYIESIREECKAVDVSIKANSQKEKAFITKFKPIEIMMIVDNMVSNARKNKIKKIVNLNIDIFQKNSGEMSLVFNNDGKPLDKEIGDPSDIFDMGFTTTNGSGLGLYHVKQVVEDLNGAIQVISGKDKGIEFILRFKNES